MFSTVCRSVTLFTIISLAAFLGWSMAEERKPRHTPDAESQTNERLEPVRFSAWDDEIVEAAEDAAAASSSERSADRRVRPQRHQVNQLYVIGTPENGVAPLPELE